MSEMMPMSWRTYALKLIQHLGGGSVARGERILGTQQFAHRIKQGVQFSHASFCSLHDAFVRADKQRLIFDAKAAQRLKELWSAQKDAEKKACDKQTAWKAQARALVARVGEGNLAKGCYALGMASYQSSLHDGSPTIFGEKAIGNLIIRLRAVGQIGEEDLHALQVNWEQCMEQSRKEELPTPSIEPPEPPPQKEQAPVELTTHGQLFEQVIQARDVYFEKRKKLVDVLTSLGLPGAAIAKLLDE